MLIRESTYKDEQVLRIKEGQLYPLLRRSQLRLTKNVNINKLSEFSSRDTFQIYAERLAKHYFPKSHKKELKIFDDIKKMYLIWLILAPLIRPKKGIIHLDWQRSNLLTWSRRVCNPSTKQWFFLTLKMDKINDIFSAIDNTNNYGIKDVYWIEDSFNFLFDHSKVQTLRGALAQFVLHPWMYLDCDTSWDEKLSWSDVGKKKRLARVSKKGSSSYVRYLDTAWVFASKNTAKNNPDLDWIDLRESYAEFLDYRIGYSESEVRVQGKKTIKGGLSIILKDAILAEVRTEAKSILESDHHPNQKLYLINELVANFVYKHRYAVSAGIQLSQLDRHLHQIVRNKLSPILGKDCLGKRYKMRADSIDKTLYFAKTNPFWDDQDEDVFIHWWTPYRI